MSLTGKVALITGGAGGIGLGIAKELLKNGAKGVAVLDVSETSGTKSLEEITTKFGPQKAIFIKADVTKSQELEDAFLDTIKTFGNLDIVFNNAGIVDEKDWERTIEINLTGVVRGSYLAMMKYLPKHKSGEEGVIVNTASISGIDSFPSIPTYSLTKSAVISLGRTLGSKEFYDMFKVKILTICPGAVDTSINANPSTNVLFPDLLPMLVETFECKETPETIGKAVVKILAEAKSGSVWVIENQKSPYEVVFPDRKHLAQVAN